MILIIDDDGGIIGAIGSPEEFEEPEEEKDDIEIPNNWKIVE